MNPPSRNFVNGAIWYIPHTDFIKYIRFTFASSLNLISDDNDIYDNWEYYMLDLISLIVHDHLISLTLDYFITASSIPIRYY